MGQKPSWALFVPWVECGPGNLSLVCQACAWLPCSWWNANLPLGGPGQRGVVTGASPGTPGVGGTLSTVCISQPLQTVPHGAGS